MCYFVSRPSVILVQEMSCRCWATRLLMFSAVEAGNSCWQHRSLAFLQGSSLLQSSLDHTTPVAPLLVVAAQKSGLPSGLISFAVFPGSHSISGSTLVNCSERSEVGAAADSVYQACVLNIGWSSDRLSTQQLCCFGCF